MKTYKVKWDANKFNDIIKLKHDIQMIAWLYQNDMTVTEDTLHNTIEVIRQVTHDLDKVANDAHDLLSIPSDAVEISVTSTNWFNLYDSDGNKSTIALMDAKTMNMDTFIIHKIVDAYTLLVTKQDT